MRALLLTFPLLAGCAGASYDAVPSPSLSPSLSSASSSSFSAPSGPAVPGRAAVHADLVVRPDVIVLGFALRETDADPQRALAAARTSVDDLARRFGEATSGASALRMSGAAFAPAVVGKSDEEVKETSAVVDGVIEVRLAPELDFWARSKLIAAITAVAREVSASAGAAKDGRRGATFEAPRAEVKDPEAHRAALADRWLRRARSFAEAAQAAPAPLLLLDCAPPGAIEQRAISLEEVGLSLSVTCRLDALAARQKGD
ncbi:hypothetical protein WME90_22615 [Sorangium sp. So ce375]|uniref:hypothetical protein n=1 Tax=Sorangium sp. So ce375 TaxID=3133306 RepID=UPI003F5BB52D